MFHDQHVPRFDPELSGELEAALQRAKDAAAGQRRVEQALEAAQAAVAATEADLNAARDKLGQSEAAQALSGGEPDKQARRRLLALRNELEVRGGGGREPAPLPRLPGAAFAPDRRTSWLSS